MSAEQLIALEAALADLGGLYAAAQAYTALRERAESELLPQMATLGRRLRSLLRRAQLTQEEIDAAAREIMGLGLAWRDALEALRDSPLYRRTRLAWEEDRQEELAQLIPQLFAGLHRVSPAPTLYLPISPASGRRGPGRSPFLKAVACADRILELLNEGMIPEVAGSEWWERDLPYLSGAATLGLLDTPLAFCLAATDVRVAVFSADAAPVFRIFSPRLRAPMSVVLAAEATDEWWQAYEDSYNAFRDSLQNELAARGLAVTILEAAANC